MALKILEEWQSGPFLRAIFMVAHHFYCAITMGPYLWFAPVLCTPAESTQDYGDWTGSSLIAYHIATCHMSSVLIKKVVCTRPDVT
jgi:hypothetical protein